MKSLVFSLSLMILTTYAYAVENLNKKCLKHFQGALGLTLKTIIVQAKNAQELETKELAKVFESLFKQAKGKLALHSTIGIHPDIITLAPHLGELSSQESHAVELLRQLYEKIKDIRQIEFKERSPAEQSLMSSYYSLKVWLYDELENLRSAAVKSYKEKAKEQTRLAKNFRDWLEDIYPRSSATKLESKIDAMIKFQRNAGKNALVMGKLTELKESIILFNEVVDQIRTLDANVVPFREVFGQNIYDQLNDLNQMSNALSKYLEDQYKAADFDRKKTVATLIEYLQALESSIPKRP